MNNIQAFTTLALAVILGFGALLTVLAAVYDFRQAKKTAAISQHPFGRRLRRRPKIAVVINVNNANNLDSCLLSIASSSYRKYQIVVVKATKDDGLSRVLNDFARSHPKRSPALASTRTLAAAVRATNAELVTVLDQPVVLGKHTLKQAALRLTLEEPASSLALNQAVLAKPTLSNLIRRFENLMHSQLKKSFAVLGLKGAATDSMARVHTTPAYKTRRKKPIASTYASDITVYPNVAGHYYSLNLTAFGLLGLSGLVAYSLYLALWHITLYPLATLWLGLSVYLWLALWADEHAKLSGKLRMGLLVPVMPGPIYLHSLVRFFKDLRTSL